MKGAPDGRVLLVRRAYPPHDWVMPGGNAEARESLLETLRREVREELGLPEPMSPSTRRRLGDALGERWPLLPVELQARSEASG